MKAKKKLTGKQKKMAVIGGTVGAVVIIIGIILIVWAAQSPSAYRQLQRARNKNEALGGYQASIQATYRATYNGVEDTMNMTGLMYTKKKPEKNMLVLQSDAQFGSHSDDNYSLATSLFSSGEKVYEKDGVTAKESDITLDEFKKACRQNKLIDFGRRDIASVQEFDGNEAGGNTCLVFQLSRVSNDILESHAKQYETMIPGEKEIDTSDITLTLAQATYIIKDGDILSQNLQISTSYEKDGLSMSYSSLTDVGFVDISEDFDFELPAV